MACPSTQTTADQHVELLERVYSTGKSKTIKFLRHRLLLSHELAEDATQTAWMKAFENIDKIKDLSKLQQWVNSTAYHAAISDKRSNHRITYVKELLPVPYRQRLDDKRLLSQLTKGITQSQVKLLLMHHIEGMSYLAMSELLGISANGVKIKLSRILKLIRLKNVKVIFRAPL